MGVLSCGGEVQVWDHCDWSDLRDFIRANCELDCAAVVIGVRLWTGFANRAEAPAGAFCAVRFLDRDWPSGQRRLRHEWLCSLPLVAHGNAAGDPVKSQISLKLAGRRGAPAIGVEDLMHAMILEDQADYSKLFPESAVAVAVNVPRPFFTAETAAEIERGLEPLMPSGAEPLPDSADMPLSDAAQRLLMAAKELGKELCGELTTARMQVERVQPLHLLAAALSDDVSATAEVLRQAGIGKETVIAAIKSGEYS